jgi:hypothetical protein
VCDDRCWSEVPPQHLTNILKGVRWVCIWDNEDIGGRQKERYFGKEKEKKSNPCEYLKDIPADPYFFIII